MTGRPAIVLRQQPGVDRHVRDSWRRARECGEGGFVGKAADLVPLSRRSRVARGAALKWKRYTRCFGREQKRPTSGPVLLRIALTSSSSSLGCAEESACGCRGKRPENNARPHRLSSDELGAASCRPRCHGHVPPLRRMIACC